MNCVLGGKDSLVVLPTGGGKSLCFQATAVALPGLAVVVSPLISLMKDQVDALTLCGVPAARLDSMSTPEERRAAADAIREGRLKLLYVAPERLVIDSFQDYLRRSGVSFFAIDEAHCISHWGHDFRPEYRALSAIRQNFPDAAIHAYTATATPQVREDITRQLGLRKPSVLIGSFFRPNLIYSVQPAGDLLPKIRAIIKRHPTDSGIIYCISRKKVDRLASELRGMGFLALPYHAGLDDATRKKNQEAFIREKCDIIVATVAFGMGIDKSNVRYVIHAGMPKSLEHYLQESGRAGRDGLDSECVLLHASNDGLIWQKIMSGLEELQRKISRSKLDEMSSYCHGSGCRHKRLVEHFGQKFERESCEACDSCLSGVVLVADGLVVAQKILSCVMRLNESQSAEYVARVLRGADSESLKEPAHAMLSTWGLLRDRAGHHVLDWIEQLLGRGYLERAEEARALKVTESGWRVLRGTESPRLRMPPAPPETASAASVASWADVDRDLFEMLRVLRRGIAEELNVPAFVVFHDSTLQEIARIRPSTLKGLQQVRGMGELKAKAHGEKVLRLIADYCKAKSVAMDVGVASGSKVKTPRRVVVMK